MRKIHLKHGVFKGIPIFICALILLTAVLILSILYAVTVGSADLSVDEVYQVILYELFHIGNAELHGSGAVHDIVWLIRLPRIVLATAVGAGLSVVGAVMQAIVQNPLADPYILGISSGASLGATLTILLGAGIFGGGPDWDRRFYRRDDGSIFSDCHFSFRRPHYLCKIGPVRRCVKFSMLFFF